MIDEAARQQLLLAALSSHGPHGSASELGLREAPARAARGLAAYRANAQVLADRALAAACPTLQVMLGEESFAALAWAFWRAHPPQRGDVGEWGDALPAWLAAQEASRDWPWLADCAALDLALHRCERAADATFDAASLALLGTADPATLRIALAPGTALVESRWPIATIHAAHRTAPDDAALEPVRAALAAGRGETVQVRRDGWRAMIAPLDPPGAAWLRALLAGADLARALDEAGSGFDFAAWLQEAVAGRGLQAVLRRAD